MPLARRALARLLLILPFAAGLTAAAGVPPLAPPAWAAGGIEIHHPWTRPGVPGRPLAVYMGIHNRGDAPDRLIAARSPRAERAELHRSEMQDGMMTMAPIAALEVPAGGVVHLAPGGYHLMVFGVEEPPREGESFPLVLVFEKAGEIPVEATVTRKPPMGDGEHMHEHQHEHQHQQMQQMQQGTMPAAPNQGGASGN